MNFGSFSRDLEPKLAFFRGPHANPRSPGDISKGIGIWGPISNSSHPDLLYQHQTVVDVHQVKVCPQKGSALIAVRGLRKSYSVATTPEANFLPTPFSSVQLM